MTTNQSLQRALTALSLRQYASARREAISILAQDPEDTFARLILGEATMRLGEFGEGRRHAEEILSRVPNWGWGFWLLGWCWLLDEINYPGLRGKAIRFGAALAAARQAIAADPSEPTFLVLAATAALERGETAAAQAFTQRGLAIAPEHAELHRLNGLVFKALNKPDQAIECFQSSLALSPDYALSHRDLAAVFFHKGKLGEAREHISEAMRLDPTDRFGRNLLFTIYQSHNWLLRTSLWLHRVTRPVRLLFPLWVIVTVLLGLPLVTWAEMGGGSPWIRLAAGTLWIAIVLLPLESLVLPLLANSISVFIDRGPIHRSMTWQEWWNRAGPGLALVAIAPVIVACFLTDSFIVADYFLTLVAVGLLQSCGAAAVRHATRRFLYGLALAYCILIPCALIHRLILVELFASCVPFLVNVLVIEVLFVARLIQGAGGR